jgi:prepilin-type N-terminal cleavage/methylation domain-containing protein
MVGMGRRQQQGASLVEVLVVIGILAIAIWRLFACIRVAFWR